MRRRPVASCWAIHLFVQLTSMHEGRRDEPSARQVILLESDWAHARSVFADSASHADPPARRRQSSRRREGKPRLSRSVSKGCLCIRRREEKRRPVLPPSPGQVALGSRRPHSGTLTLLRGPPWPESA